MIKTVWLGLLLALNPAADQTAPQPVDVADYYGTNPTLGDTSFAKTVSPHAGVPQFRVQGANPQQQADLTDGRWGDPGDVRVYRPAVANANENQGSHWLGLAGLLGLLGLRRGRAKRPASSTEEG
ncbi:hypothetical protein [Paenibacillus mucilaginosus]|uniref:MYXO-CTERM domain-containing protein n=1 Tax=Paenibacillus mucilaginosus (strain KNP414) TaxID=1036673 RepID=F8FBW8_PAEMK|nr:hypothetical protein [Paenibacillus mucilaginosus]AEI43729.1 hypothetical protein KNP414_05205 [Paenibacillus mucilaginosus KNP414]MCG7212745.1 hypothetical protein [Paenibacillus mucilaginosus]WDM25241.1 hypothetical protein KCX80_22580 [Paenibacillus mucilaginosus]